MPINSKFQIPRGTPRTVSIRKAIAILNQCDCLKVWEHFTDLSIECSLTDLALSRIQWCMNEQVWGPRDVDDLSFTESDRTQPYPKVAHQCLLQKVKGIKSQLREIRLTCSRQRRALMDRHANCPTQRGRSLYVLLDFTNVLVKERCSLRRSEIMNERSVLISGSNWSKHVNTAKVRNLTDNELNNTELEVLSLGCDFRLQGSDRSIIDTIIGFERYDARYKNKSGYSDLHNDKVKIVSSLEKDRMDTLPLRYRKALVTIKANKNIMVTLSDKGKETIVVYKSTYLSLSEAHFSNRDLYTPVEESDITGMDLKSLTTELISKLNALANEANDPNTKRIIKSLMPPDEPRFPEARVNLKTHKDGITPTDIPVRPIISNSNAPTAPMAAFLGKRLTNNLGLVSDKHIKSTEEFSEFIKTCSTKGRMLSLDVVNLFTCIPTKHVISFLRNMSNGWGPSPPPEANPVTPPIYNFDIDSKLFCDLVELCLSFNQFHINGRFLRQIHGLFMGSSISPPLAMMYLEHFEEHIYEVEMPNDIKPTEWERYVDDSFIVYEHNIESFERFFNKLNALDPFINFTCEDSITGENAGFGSEVSEALPFLDLMITRHHDGISNSFTNKLSIYRKPCHSGSYIHSLSSQPTSTKRSVIRNMFLRAFRYCDNIFLEAEERRIYADFSKLGYSRRFIEKAKISARRGREHEIQVRLGVAEAKAPRPKQPFHLVLPFNKRTQGTKHTYLERGIDVVFTNTDTIKTRVTSKERRPTQAGVYILTCDTPTCEEVYVGQSQHIPTRLDNHRDAIRGVTSSCHYASAKHSRKPGHNIDPSNALTPYRSTSKLHRLIVETSLITLCNTVKDSKATSNVRDMDTIGPIILRASKIDWKALAEAQPSLSHSIVPRTYQRFFGTINQPIHVPSIVPPHTRPRPPEVTHEYSLRSLVRNDN